MANPCRLLPPFAALLVAACSFAGHARAEERSKVAEEVEWAVDFEGRARVIVFLDVPQATGAALDEARLAIAKSQDLALSALGNDGFETVRRFTSVPAVAGMISRAGLARIASVPGLIRIDLDRGGTGGLAQAVPITNANDLHAQGLTGLGITVAVIDSGVDTDHPDLVDDLDGEACFCTTGCCPGGLTTRVGPGSAEDDHGHGSNVSGIVTSGGLVSSIGVAPDAKLVAVKVLDSSNSFCCVSDVVAGLDWIINSRPDVDVVNMSLGTFALYPGDCDNADSGTLSLAAAINTLRSRRTMTFASAMNNASGTSMGAPACVAAAISVGATYDANLGPVGYSNCSDATTAVDKVTCFSNSNSSTDVFAPGAAITSDSLAGGLSTFFGTSQASPHAAGCAADLMQAKPSASVSELESALESTGVTVVDPKNGLSFPRIDCLAARDELLCSGPADCDDGVFCNGAEVCNAGSCGPGSLPACGDADPCTIDSCGSEIVYFFDDLQSGGAGWTHAGFNDTWHLASTTCFGDPLPSTMFLSNGNAGAVCALNNRLERSRLLSPAIVMPPSGPLTLSFKTVSFDQAGRCTATTEPDSHDVRITTDNAATFTTLNNCTAIALGGGNAASYSFDVSAWVGQTVKVFFWTDTKNSTVGHTFAIDEVKIARTIDTCVHAAAPNGGACDDADPATCADSCTAGACAGTPVAPPAEVNQSVVLAKGPGATLISWSDAPGPFNVYRGQAGGGPFLPYDHVCLASQVASPASDSATPLAGAYFYYLISRVDQCRESVPGHDGNGAPIPNVSPCP